jgi:lipopolysaccharide transport system permease protein
MLPNLRELWAYRELLYFFVWRDVKVRYKQTVLGVAWAVIQPVFMMFVFTLFFGQLARVPSDGVPYPIFAYVALLPWNLFARGLTDASTSLVANQNLVTKVYFPRLMLPASAVLAGFVDFSIAFTVLVALMLYYGIVPTLAIITLPIFVAIAVLSAMGIGFWFSALDARYRDIRYTLPFLTQFWLFATPVVYPLSLVPDSWRWIYALNPMVGVVEGFRWALLGEAWALDPLSGVSIAVVVVMFLGGLLYFRRAERTLADVV